MNANDYQRAAIRTDGTTSVEDRLMNAALGLAGEAGEFANHIKKWRFHGHELDRGYCLKELGDIAWYIGQAATALGALLGDVLSENLAKLARRYPQGFSSEASLNRKE